MTDGFCLEGLRCVARSLRRAFHDGHDAEARSDMSMASLLSGLALANAGLGVVHGFAGPVGGMFPAPHGAICAAMLPYGMDANIRALRSRAPESESLGRYQTVASILTGRPNASAEDGVKWTAEVCRELSIPSLGSYGVAQEYIHVLVEKAMRASSMKANPVALTPEELGEVLARAL
jgi:alcohol dehydrogenase class IV